MTVTLLCDSTALPAVPEAMQVSAHMSVFLADELLPLMAGLWPASANQLDSNVRGVAMAWGLQLSGLTPDQITDAVLELAGDTSRQFAPRPAEVKALVVRLMQANQPVTPTGQTLSIRACEMIAEVRVLKRDGAAPAERVAAELASLQAELRQRGVTVTGRMA